MQQRTSPDRARRLAGCLSVRRARAIAFTLGVLTLGACVGETTVPGPDAQAVEAAPLVPRGWMRSAPTGDPLASERARVLLRLTAPQLARVEALYGPAGEHGRLRGWWLRPLAPRPTGAWLMLSVSGAMYGVAGPPGPVLDGDGPPLRAAARAWRAIIVDRATP